VRVNAIAPDQSKQRCSIASRKTEERKAGASAAPQTFAIHNYPVEKRCPISRSIKGYMSSVLQRAQNTFEHTLDGMTLADVVGEIRRVS